MTVSRRNRQLVAVRLWLHDQICASDYCTGDLAYDHAHRTQHENARAIVDADEGEPRRRAIHDAFCIYAARGVDCYDGTSGAYHPRVVQDRLDQLLHKAQEVLDHA